MPLPQSPKQTLCAALALAIPVLATPVLADESSVKFSGFGTLMANKSDNSRVTARSNNQPTPPNSSGGDWTFEPHSLIAGQMDVAPDSDLSATVQVIGMQRNEGDFDPTIEWAFVRYKIDNNWQVRVGRVLTPVFMESEYRFVGYGRTTTSASVNLYGFYPLSTHDGFDITYRTALGDGMIKATLYGGESKYDSPDGADDKYVWYEADKLYGGVLSWENDSLLARLNILHADFTAEGHSSDITSIGPTADFMRQMAGLGLCSSVCYDEADDWSNTVEGAKYDLVTAAIRWNMDALTLSLEAFQRETDSIIADADGMQFVGSYNLGAFTPYITYTNVNTNSNDSATFPTNTVSPGANAAFSSLNRAYLRQNTGREVVGIGVRWDVKENYAIKAEIENYAMEEETGNFVGYPGVFDNDGYGTRPTQFNTYTVGVDFVF